MFKNVSSQKIAVFAFDTTTGAAKTGDSANITVYVNKDWAGVNALTDTSATEIDNTNAKGWYLFDVTQTESNADALLFTGKSTTANISVVGQLIFTTPANFSTLSVDSSGRVDVIKINGTSQTARDIGASVLLSSGTGTGQLSITSGIAKVDVDTIKTNPVVNGGTITFPTGATLASTTNISAGTVTTATNVTTVNGLASGVITATSIAADAITAAKVADGTIDAATFAAGAINAAAIAADAITDAKVASDVTIASVTGAVGSVTGNVGGNVTGSIGSLATQAKADVNAEVDTAISDVGLTTTITGRIDVATSTRLASGSYTAPDNTSITAIKTQTDKLAFTVTNQVDANVLDWKSSTAPAMTGDAYARLGAPAGASVSADISSVKSDSGAIKTQTDKFAFTVPNQVDANIQSVNDVTVTGTGSSGDEWGP